MMCTSSRLIRQLFPPRPPDSHKYDFGHLLIIAGNKQYTGAPALVAMAALRAGVDLVTLVAPQRAADIAATCSPSIITYPLSGDFLMEKHFDEIMRLAAGKDAIAIGPGLGREEETLATVRRLVETIDIPVVIDADAIYAFNSKSAVSSQSSVVIRQLSDVVFTPHAREFQTLTGIDVSAMKIDAKTETVKNAAQKLDAIILLKGPIDIISDGADIYLNKTGSPYMTSGGTGDVLTGILGALLARTCRVRTSCPHPLKRMKFLKGTAMRAVPNVTILKPKLTSPSLLEITAAAAYISGKAGELAGKRFRDSLIATDVIDKISSVVIRYR